MRLRPGAAALATIVLAVTLGGGLPNAAAARSQAAPQTLARAAAVGSRPLTGPGRIDFVGVHWRGGERDGGRVRFRRGGTWTAWQRLEAGDIHPPGRIASELVSAARATAYEVRAPQGASDVRAVAINTTDGPRATAAPQPAATRRALGLPGPCYRSRAQWGADESLRFDAAGTEVWPPQYFPAQRLTIHHTATVPGLADGETDPAAIVRGIYRYHAVDLGFGDIGYHLLVDQQGCVYEGRYSGPDALPVYALPQTPGRPDVVTAGHTLHYNPGNIGVALLGNFNDLQPSEASLRSLTATLAALSLVSGLDPRGYGTYVNPITGATKDTDVISGHRDWLDTECPGTNLYARLPELREAVSSWPRSYFAGSSSPIATLAGGPSADGTMTQASGPKSLMSSRHMPHGVTTRPPS
jgi:N-acetylmuramoyl-L-alanine amidase